jgi:DNA-binding CsgD family transcriptional regulator
MVDSWARSQARARIERACTAALDDRALRLEILAQLQRGVGYDAYAWPLTDPVTAVGQAPLADVPCLPELPELIRLKYASRINRWTALASSARPARSLAQRTGGDLARSLLWRGILDRHDIGDTASTVFADAYGCWGFLDLWRQRADRPFTEDDVRFLAGIAPAVTVALRTRQARAFTTQPAAAPTPEGPAVLVLDQALRITASTSAAASWLRRLQPGPPGTVPVPAVVYNVAAQLLAAEAGADAHQPSTRVQSGEHGWVTVRAGRLDALPAGGGPPAITVTIEPTGPSQRLELFARSHGLTARERQLLVLVAGGGDTRHLARAMGVSAHTVQDHLKSIFAKTVTNSRQALLATALGTSRHDPIGSAASPVAGMRRVRPGAG